jgi:hypothetical protein
MGGLPRVLPCALVRAYPEAGRDGSPSQLAIAGGRHSRAAEEVGQQNEVHLPGLRS